MEYKEIEIGKYKSLQYLDGHLFYVKEKGANNGLCDINKITLSKDFKDDINEILFFLFETKAFYHEALKQNQDSRSKIDFFQREICRIERITNKVEKLLCKEVKGELDESNIRI